MAASSREGGGDERVGLLRRPVELPLWAVAVLVGVALLLGILLWSVLDRRTSHVAPPPLADFEELLPSIAGVTGSPIIDGNAVSILQDAAFFDALLEDVAAARTSVHFETYVWWRGEVCRRLAEAFAERARAGLEVRVLVDAVGGGEMADELRRLMRDAGVHLAFFHAFEIEHLAKHNNRDHRKLAIVDGRVGYAFGHGVAEEWITGTPYRDTAVRIEGPVVAALQSVFLENWIETTGEVPVGEAVFPPLAPAGEVRAHVVASSHQGQVSSVELLYKLAIAAALDEVLVQNPYFLPDPDLLDLILDAAGRGVRVSIMVPGPESTDSATVLHASHRHYGALLEAGVRLYQYRPSLLHQKVLVVDGLWSHVGSTNFDSRSFEINDEVSVGLIDEAVAEQLAAAFRRDVRDSRLVTLEEWRRGRSVWHRALDRLAHLVHEQI